jgi:hypothetical protein
MSSPAGVVAPRLAGPNPIGSRGPPVVVRDRTDYGTNSTDAIWGRARGAGTSIQAAARAHDDLALAPLCWRGLFSGQSPRSSSKQYFRMTS